MSVKKIESTRNYHMFLNNSGENRPLDIKKHKKLIESMREYGFIDSFPIIVSRNSKGQLIVKDGQHRLAIAQSLGLPVHWVEDTIDFDVAKVNGTPKPWMLIDYAQRFADNGIKSYEEGLEFTKQHNLPISIAFSLLAGTTSFGNFEAQFYNGTFKVKDRAWADAVAGVYGPLIVLSPALKKNIRLIEACMAVCRVPNFDSKRLLSNAERCREKLICYSQREPYLQMLEEIYNFGRKQLVPLKVEATMAMRERNAVKPKKSAKATDHNQSRKEKTENRNSVSI